MNQDSHNLVTGGISLGHLRPCGLADAVRRSPVREARVTGSAAPARIGGHRKPLLAGHEALLHELAWAEPGITVAEIRAELTRRGIRAGSLTTMWAMLRRLDLRHNESC